MKRTLVRNDGSVDDIKVLHDNVRNLEDGQQLTFYSLIHGYEVIYQREFYGWSHWKVEDSERSLELVPWHF